MLRAPFSLSLSLPSSGLAAGRGHLCLWFWAPSISRSSDLEMTPGQNLVGNKKMSCSQGLSNAQLSMGLAAGAVQGEAHQTSETG